MKILKVAYNPVFNYQIKLIPGKEYIMLIKAIFKCFFLISLLLTTLTSCKRNSTEFKTDEVKIDQKILFHYSYDNYAWGHDYYGWYIDNMGNVYILNETNHWWEEEMNLINRENKTFLYDYDSLNQVYEENSDAIIATIDLDTLDFYYQLIGNAANGEYFIPDFSGADMGSSIYGCLYYNKQNNKYEKIILSCDGDWVIKNLDPSAIRIDIWLKGI